MCVACQFQGVTAWSAGVVATQGGSQSDSQSDCGRSCSGMVFGKVIRALNLPATVIAWHITVIGSATK